jgi:NTP pyrophosphatase (non-canonical NTP hydrolase)
MDLNTYQKLAMGFRLPTATPEYAMLNLAGEVGELLSKAAKIIRDGGDVVEFRSHICKELGDIMWMVAAITSDHNLTLEEVAQGNIDKLSSRKSRDTLQGSGDNR